MKSMAFAATLAVLTLCGMAFTAEVMAETKVIEIKGKYSKIKLDGICSANGGTSYSQSGGGYGCTKGNNTVECDQGGNCKGYTSLVVQPGKTVSGKVGSPRAVLQMEQGPTKPDINTNAIGGAQTGGAVVAP